MRPAEIAGIYRMVIFDLLSGSAMSGCSRNNPETEFSTDVLSSLPGLRIRDVYCRGTHRDKGGEESVAETEIVFPYRGTYVRHLGSQQAVAEANQVLFFNRSEEYRISHPVPGGDASVTLRIDPALLVETVPKGLLADETTPRFLHQRLRIDARAQVLVAMLRHSLRQGIAEPLEAESLALTLIQRALGPRTTHAASSSSGRQLLVDRVKLVLAGDLARRWTLAEIGAELRCSPVYLTQVFQQVEGMPLYRYQLRLRLARALDLLDRYDDLTELALELGFSSHSHFSASFRSAYGRSPTEFKRSALRR